MISSHLIMAGGVARLSLDPPTNCGRSFSCLISARRVSLRLFHLDLGREGPADCCEPRWLGTSPIPSHQVGGWLGCVVGPDARSRRQGTEVVERERPYRPARSLWPPTRSRCRAGQAGDADGPKPPGSC